MARFSKVIDIPLRMKFIDYSWLCCGDCICGYPSIPARAPVGGCSPTRRLRRGRRQFGNFVPGPFSPILAKHTKRFSLEDVLLSVWAGCGSRRTKVPNKGLDGYFISRSEGVHR